MDTLAPGLTWIDLLFLGRRHAIATVVVRAPGSVALIDPGPSTCLESLDMGLQAQGLRLSDVTELLLTHIHLDHAGVAGTLVRRLPHVRVVVHEKGAPHIADPTKLLASATRLYGDRMDELWGEVAPVPERNLTVVRGGEQIEAGGRVFEIAYTPGHASHHVSYFDRASTVAFVGDSGGVCIDGGYILPPTPPPDIDIEAWHASVARIEAWSPATIFMTHFGPVNNPRPHLTSLLKNLDTLAALVRARLSESGDDAEQSRRFADDLAREWRRYMTEEQLAAYRAAAPPALVWMGLARYWRRRGAEVAK